MIRQEGERIGNYYKYKSKAFRENKKVKLHWILKLNRPFNLRAKTSNLGNNDKISQSIE